MNDRFIRIVMIVAGLWLGGASAHAATATYVIPSIIGEPDLSELSTQGDGEGFLLGLGDTLGIVLDDAVGVSSGGNISVFTLAPDSGAARATIRIGNYNNGAPQFAISGNVRAGNTRSFTNLFNRGCGILGGCNYIEIITNRTRRGADGVDVDYVTVDGELVQVASPTPEPSVWTLMILGFAAVALRLKALRRNGATPGPYPRATPRPALA